MNSLHQSRLHASPSSRCLKLPLPCLTTSHHDTRLVSYLSRRSHCASRALPDTSSSGAWRDEDVLQLESFLKSFKSIKSQDTSSSSPPLAAGPGDVYLVGTGPGDPTLLTVRAVQLMQRADVVLYDRLVSEDILRLVSPSALMVYVGKHSGLHTRTQEEIHNLLLAFSQSGATVLRLKGGDPYVYGRGGEEVQYLKSRGIKVHCIPGITAAAGICAELGIPMTHRGVATSARFLTGHSRDGGEDSLECQMTAAGIDAKHTTLIVYMGLATLPRLQRQLAESGLDPGTPSVAVERGTTIDQRVVFSPLDQLPDRPYEPLRSPAVVRVNEAGLESPTLIIIGEVVALAPGWEEWQGMGRPLEWKDESSSSRELNEKGDETSEIISISLSLDGLKR